MQSQALIPQFTLSELFFQVYRSGCLTRNQRQYLKATLLQDALTEEEQSAIDRVIYAVRRGWLKMAE
ncbi:hypothetical protein [Phormidium sp. CCY1219]|uniref:hypothetical protein n=1 Tax=Phormidium sp. CCY1219 TaxID=2886104 RepID=UPI002D1E6508|nr:hypothetical protein [Phormidium sp. CCY1219]MEB3829020.1 hypothetical protein [Phormidium sp. CCY1219]